MLGLGEQRRLQVIGDSDGQSPALFYFAKASEGKRRRPAGGDSDQHIARIDRAAPHQPDRLLGLVLRAFHGSNQRFAAADDQQQ
jgi:hypothetical protein